MRIRKRFPSSSLSSLSLTDPQLNRPPVVQQHLQGSVQAYPDGNLCVQQGNINSQPSDPPNQPLPPASNQRLMIGRGWTRWASSDTIEAQEVKQQEMEDEEVKQERWGEEEKSNDIRKESILGAEVGTQILPPSASSHQEIGRWYEGDKVVPLKKRRGSFERRVSEESIPIPEKEKKMKAKMKSKTNKKCSVQQNGTADEQEDYKEGKDDEGINNSSNSTSIKKSKRGSVIMEGSRCSRVNGRGWRCCQQTLVGYSLCEHHLGKGRLRSINNTASVRSGRAMGANSITDLLPNLLDSQRSSISSMDYINVDDEDDDDDDNDDYEKKPLMMTKKKKMKLGVVKARSISSLLGQTNNAVVVADNNKNNRL